MAILETCCCFRTVRKGSFASAIYTMVYDSIAIIITSIFVHEERNYFFGNATQPRSTTLIEPDTISPTTMVYNILLLIGCCCGLVSSLLLIYGLMKDNRIFLIPWILTVFVKTVIDVSHSFYLVTLAAKRLNPVHIILFTLDFFLLVLTIYAFLCVVSQYQEYKAGRGRAEDDVLRYPMSNVPQPTATSCLSTRKAGTYHETTATEPHSTMVTNDCAASSPFQPPRKPSSAAKHVQFDALDPQRQPNGNNLTLWDGGEEALITGWTEIPEKNLTPKVVVTEMILLKRLSTGLFIPRRNCRHEHYPARVGDNLPFNIYNRTKFTILTTIFLTTGLGLPCLFYYIGVVYK